MLRHGTLCELACELADTCDRLYRRFMVAGEARVETNAGCPLLLSSRRPPWRGQSDQRQCTGSTEPCTRVALNRSYPRRRSFTHDDPAPQRSAGNDRPLERRVGSPGHRI
jgi:hypothetical protein